MSRHSRRRGGWLLQQGSSPERNLYFQARLATQRGDEFVRQAENVTLAFQELTESIQELRLQVDRELSDAASTINTPSSNIGMTKPETLSTNVRGR